MPVGSARVALDALGQVLVCIKSALLGSLRLAEAKHLPQACLL